MDTLFSFLKVLLEIAPEMKPQIETAIEQYGEVHKVPTDKYIRAVRSNKFDEIDERIDGKIDDLDIPE